MTSKNSTHEEEPDSRQDQREFSESADSLWLLTISPATWALHFVVSYASTAIVCARYAETDMPILRWSLSALSLAAISFIAWVGWRSLKRWDVLNDPDHEHTLSREEDRHEFLGHASVLLSIISAIGVLYTFIPVLLMRSCQ